MTFMQVIRVIAAVVPLMALSLPARAVSVRLIPSLTSITFYERTGGVAPTAFTFSVGSPELTTRLSDPLGPGNHDIPGAPTEFYDVFYSNADGTFNPNGEYLTIEGVFLQGLPQGGGLNLAEIALNFTGGLPSEFGSFVASFVALGDNAIPGDVGLAIDNNLLTHTTMGNTIGQAQRLRVTLGFRSASGAAAITPGPIPTLSEWGLFLLSATVAAAAWLAMRRRRPGWGAGADRGVDWSARRPTCSSPSRPSCRSGAASGRAVDVSR